MGGKGGGRLWGDRRDAARLGHGAEQVVGQVPADGHVALVGRHGLPSKDGPSPREGGDGPRLQAVGGFEAVAPVPVPGSAAAAATSLAAAMIPTTTKE